VKVGMNITQEGHTTLILF